MTPGGGAAPRGIDVTTAGDRGAGTLRAALETASADPHPSLIRIAPGLGDIILDAPLVYSGATPLAVDGGGAVLFASGLVIDGASPALRGALVANGGGDLTLRDLTIRGSTGIGLLVSVPPARRGEITVTLERVTVEDCRLHGVLVNDQAAYFSDHETRDATGSPAGVRVVMRSSRLVRNGWGGLDNDGLRVNEGGDGSLDVSIADSVADDNGGEGIELDERGPGDAIVTVEGTRADRNGGLTTDDLDDGIDVDETGPGSIVARFDDVSASGNAQQGIELNENNAGDLRVTLSGVTADDNGAEGIEVEEDDHVRKHPDEPWGGDLDATLTDVSTSRNGSGDGDAALELREKADGDLTARIVRHVARDNAIDDLRVRESEGGTADVTIDGT